jgi:hypothetical protein
LLDPVPLSAWHTQLGYYQNKEDRFTMDFWANGPTYFPSSRSGYAPSASQINPYLAIPSKVTELDPLWSACRINDGIIFDPPKVMTVVVDSSLALPTLSHTAPTAPTAPYTMQPMPGADIPNPTSAQATQAPPRPESNSVSGPNAASSVKRKLEPTFASSRRTPPSAIVIAGSVTLVPGQAAATLIDGRIVSAGQNAIVVDTTDNGRVNVPYAAIAPSDSSGILSVSAEDLNDKIPSSLESGWDFGGVPVGSLKEGFGKSSGESSSIAGHPTSGPAKKLAAISTSAASVKGMLVKNAATWRYMIRMPAVFVAGLVSVAITLG